MDETLDPPAIPFVYRWFQSKHPESPPEEAWSFAQSHWQEFVGPCQDYDTDSDDDDSPAALDYEGQSLLLAEK